MKTYRKKATHTVFAIQASIKGNIYYEKWDHNQKATEGDYLVDNEGDVYTVEKVTFESTYTEVGDHRYAKTALVKAEQATESGKIRTLEGLSSHNAGDYIVHNPRQGDVYVVPQNEFESVYEEIT